MSSFIKFCVIILFALLFTEALLAQSQQQFPYTLNTKREIALTGAGLALQGVGIIFNKDKDNRHFTFSNAQENDIPFFDEWSVNYHSEDAARASDVAELVGIACPLLLAGNEFLKDYRNCRVPTDNAGGKRCNVRGLIVLTMYVQTMIITTGMINTTKGIVNRYRPYVYSNNFPDDKNDAYAAKSFFSGHTAATAASTFFAAKIFSDVYPESKWKNAAWITAATIPAVTGALRIGAGRHFLSDVLAGYAVGAAVGILVPQLHKDKKGDGVKAQFIPLYNKGLVGLGVEYSFP